MLKKSLLILSLMFASLTANAGIIGAGTSQLGVSGSSYVDDGSELFRLTDTSGLFDDTQFFTKFSLDVGNNSGDHSFGIFLWDITDQAKVGNNLTLFDGTAGGLAGLFANIAWDVVGKKATNVANSQSIDYSGLLGHQFGFGTWFESDGFTSYSVSALNGGNNYASYHWATNNPGDAFNLYAYHEDNDVGGTLDAILVGITDVQQVPEPGTIAMFGAAMFGMVAMRKRKSARVTSA